MLCGLFFSLSATLASVEIGSWRAGIRCTLQYRENECEMRVVAEHCLGVVLQLPLPPAEPKLAVRDVPSAACPALHSLLQDAHARAMRKYRELGLTSYQCLLTADRQSFAMPDISSEDLAFLGTFIQLAEGSVLSQALNAIIEYFRHGDFNEPCRTRGGRQTIFAIISQPVQCPISAEDYFWMLLESTRRFLYRHQQWKDKLPILARHTKMRPFVVGLHQQLQGLLRELSPNEHAAGDDAVGWETFRYGSIMGLLAAKQVDAEKVKQDMMRLYFATLKQTAPGSIRVLQLTLSSFQYRERRSRV